MAMPNGGGVEIEKFAYYSKEGEWIKGENGFGQMGSPNAEILASLLRSRRKSTAYQDKGSLDDQGNQMKHPSTDCDCPLSCPNGLPTSRMWTAEGWLYVAAVIDPFSRRVVGWSMSAAMTAQFVDRCPGDGDLAPG